MNIGYQSISSGIQHSVGAVLCRLRYLRGSRQRTSFGILYRNHDSCVISLDYVRDTISTFEEKQLILQRLYRLKRFDPQIWLPTLTLAWGIASVGQGLITNQAGLLGVRFCTYPDCLLLARISQLIFIVLGVTEAGLFPGVIFLFSVYYRR